MYRFVSSRRLDHRFSQPCWAGDKQRRTSTACSSRNPCGLRRFEHRSGPTQQSRALLEVADPLDVLSRKRRARLRGPLPGTTTYQIRAPFGERDELTAGDDEVVERADVPRRRAKATKLAARVIWIRCVECVDRPSAKPSVNSSVAALRLLSRDGGSRCLGLRL